jgi:hypothetical protein
VRRLWFAHYIERFRNDFPVTAVIRVEKGHQGEYGWGVCFEQGRHRCILAGTVANRPAEEAWEDALWTACAERASSRLVLGQPEKIHVEKLWTPDEFAHMFEEGMYEQQFGIASEYCREQMVRFAVGTQSFGQHYEWHSYADSDPPKRADYHAYHAAASQRIRISDGPSLLDQSQVVFAAPASQEEAPGTSPQSANPTVLLQFWGRVFGGPGAAGTGSSVSAPDWDRSNVLAVSGGF